MKAPSPNWIRAGRAVDEQIAAFDQTLQANLYELSKKNQILNRLLTSNQVSLTALNFDIGQLQLANGSELCAVCGKAIDDLAKARQLINELLAGAQASFATKVANLQSIALKKEQLVRRLIEQERIDDCKMATYLSRQIVQRAFERALAQEQREQMSILLASANQRGRWSQKGVGNGQLAQRADAITQTNDQSMRGIGVDSANEVEDLSKKERSLSNRPSLQTTLDLLNEISLESHT